MAVFRRVSVLPSEYRFRATPTPEHLIRSIDGTKLPRHYGVSFTRTGVMLDATEVPLPSCPRSFPPQQ